MFKFILATAEAAAMIGVAHVVATYAWATGSVRFNGVLADAYLSAADLIEDAIS